MASDPHYNQRVLGLHFDGANGSTTFVDNSPNPKTVTANGGAQISTAQGKFGGSSCYFDGGSTLSIPDSDDFWFGSQNLTVSVWIYVSSPITSTQIICGQWSSSTDLSWNIGIGGGNIAFIESSVNGAYDVLRDIISASNVIQINAWNHILFSRNGNDFKLFVDGQAVASATLSGSIFNSTSPFIIGNGASGQGFNGYLDDLYIYKGTALYAANFTPPTEPYDDFEPKVGIISAASGASTGEASGSMPQVGGVSGVSGASTGNVAGAMPQSGIVNASSSASTGAANATISIKVDKQTIVSRKYFARLSGTPDITIPIFSINTSMRFGGGSTATVVCPDGINYDADIIARAAGILTITAFEYYMDGSEASSESLVIHNLNISYAHGARSYSITMQGSILTQSATVPRKYDLKGIQSITLQNNGNRRVRCDLDKDIRPNDIAVLPDTTEFTIGQIQHIIAANTKAMEVSE